MEKITDEELKQIKDYYQKELERTATIGKLKVESIVLTERLREVTEELLMAEDTYLKDNKTQFSLMQSLLKKYNATEINTATGEYTK